LTSQTAFAKKATSQQHTDYGFLTTGGGHGELNSAALDIENCIGSIPLQKSDLVVSVAPYSHPRTKPFAENCGTESEILFRHLSPWHDHFRGNALPPQKSG
jgi:hypothetical protein